MFLLTNNLHHAFRHYAMMLWLTVEWVHFDYDLLRVTITPRISNRNICFLVIKVALCTFVKYMETKKKWTHILFGGWLLLALMIEDSRVSRMNLHSATALIPHHSVQIYNSNTHNMKTLYCLRRPDRKSTRLNSSHLRRSRMPSSA